MAIRINTFFSFLAMFYKRMGDDPELKGGQMENAPQSLKKSGRWNCGHESFPPGFLPRKIRGFSHLKKSIQNTSLFANK
jgi:hypothetical protein